MRPKSWAVMGVAFIVLASRSWAASSDLSLVARPVHRIFELGEAIWVDYWIVNPSQRPVVVLSRRAAVAMHGTDEMMPIIPHTGSWYVVAGKVPSPSRLSVIRLGMMDVGWSVGRGEHDAVAVRASGRVMCSLFVDVAVGSFHEREIEEKLSATTSFWVVERLAEYEPPLRPEDRNNRWLHRIQASEWMVLSEPEFAAAKAFALRNAHAPIGKNLLYRLATRCASTVPAYIRPAKRPSRPLTFTEVIHLTNARRRELCRGGTEGPAGPQSEIVVELLSRLVAEDDGNFVFYTSACRLLATHLACLGRLDEAEKARTHGMNMVPGDAAPDEETARGSLWKLSDETGPLISRRASEDGLSAQAVSVLMETPVEFTSTGGQMRLSELIALLGELAGQSLPVEYQGAGIADTMIHIGDGGAPIRGILGPYLHQVVERHGLAVKQSGGRIAVSRVE